ncbi:hypothetical protein D9757_001995 [Collybiopsis confluens]|uniref:FAR-17a/AIG1-like protein n=1 Tax=Collybiopsis confluens TaxID=2823264 RepID=A0A8H5HXS6_9AGAR|nr:hypothetical protein D9757_001995 [Collybiopsis confluens]
MVARSLLHSLAVMVMIYGYQRLQALPIDAVVKNQYGGHFQYLTIQGVFLACATTLISLILDIFPSTTGRLLSASTSPSNPLPVLKPLKRIMLLVSLPLTVVISSVYWPLLLLATHLILPTEEGSPSSQAPQLMRIPLSTDLALHAMPAISMLGDFLLFEKRCSLKELRYGAPSLSFIYTIFYTWWVERCASFNGKFPYPFLETTLEIRISIYCGAGLLALLSFPLINKLHS